jgi:hypothetical protein
VKVKEGGDIRFVNKFGPDPLHVFVRFDHLCVIICWSGEQDIVFSG